MEVANNQDQDKSKIEIRKLDIKAIIIGVLGLLTLFIFPIIATQCNLWFDYSNTGQIGDTVGGLTAPIIGFFSALLIYFSFRAQVIANFKIQKQIDDQKKDELEKKEFNYQMEIYKHIIVSIDNLQYVDATRGKDSKIDKGALALFLILRDLESTKNQVQLGNYYYIFIHTVLNQFDSILNSFENPKNKNFDIRLVLQLIDYLFQQEFNNPVKNQIERAMGDPSSIDPIILRIYKRILRIRLRLSKLLQVQDMKQLDEELTFPI